MLALIQHSNCRTFKLCSNKVELSIGSQISSGLDVKESEGTLTGLKKPKPRNSRKGSVSRTIVSSGIVQQ